MTLRLIIILICFSSACFSQNGVFVNDTIMVGVNNTTMTSVGCGKITVSDCLLDTITKGNYHLDKVEINNNCIDLYVSFGCGCGRSDFELITDGQFLLTGTPTIKFVLRLTTNDGCQKLCYIKVSFDLSQYNNLVKESGLFVSILGTNYTLTYGK